MDLTHCLRDANASHCSWLPDEVTGQLHSGTSSPHNAKAIDFTLDTRAH